MATEKSNRQFTVTLNHSIGTLEIRATKLDPEKFPALVFHRERASQATRTCAEMLGWKNRLVDMSAKGQMVSADVKYAAMQRGIEHFESGTEDWGLRAVRAPSEDDAMLISALVELAMAKNGQADRAKIAAAVKSWDSAKRYAVRQRADVKKVLDRMIEEASQDIDSDELMEDLGI